MTEKELMIMVHGMFRTIIKDKTYFYHSSVGANYCHLTDEGRRALIEMLDMVAPKLYEAMNNEDIERSKQLVFKELTKGE